MQNENQVELSFSTQWNGGSHAIPVNLDKRYYDVNWSSNKHYNRLKIHF